MSRYINREEALSFPFANGRYDHKNADENFILGCESYKEWLENLPTADVISVVRCKDCKYAYMTDDGYCNWCDIMADLLGLEYDDIHLPGDWFCADGKKVTES